MIFFYAFVVDYHLVAYRRVLAAKCYYHAFELQARYSEHIRQSSRESKQYMSDMLPLPRERRAKQHIYAVYAAADDAMKL